MTKSYDLERLRISIKKAFPAGIYNLKPCVEGDPEADEFNCAFEGTSWLDHSLDEYMRFSMVIVFMTRQASRYFLPGFMTAALEELRRYDSPMAVVAILETWIGESTIVGNFSDEQITCIRSVRTLLETPGI